MALFSINSGKLLPVPTTTFAAESILERKHLQKMLMADTSPLGEELLVLCEEYGNWEDSNRRIDLLCLDKQGALVVVEIKRTEDGGHMELQAIRYAAMVSSMTIDQAVEAYTKTLGLPDDDSQAKGTIADFLDADSIEDVELNPDVRIILVAADFSPEITTSVIWLNQRALDIRCIRLRPYKNGSEVLVDATQIIPLPEAADYEVKIREQAQEAKKKFRTKRQEILRRFWAQFIEKSASRTPLFSNRSATTDHWLSAGVGRSGFSLTVSLTEDRTRVECYIRPSKDEDVNKAAFRALAAKKDEIETIFGRQLTWEDLPKRSGCRISTDYDLGGWKSPEDSWPAMIEWATENSLKLEQALKSRIQALQL